MKKIVVLLTTVLLTFVLISCCDCSTNSKENEDDIIETVTIGEQVWMLKNLSTSYYLNGDEIWNAKTQEEWIQAGKLGIGAWCYPENAPGLGVIYGKLYNWYAVNDERGLAPKGWRVPSDEDWQELEDYYGANNAGAYLKSNDKELWKEPVNGANNLSGFTAIPSGIRTDNGIFSGIGYYAFWWSATEEIHTTAYGRYLQHNLTTVTRNTRFKNVGYSVRCLKN